MGRVRVLILLNVLVLVISAGEESSVDLIRHVLEVEPNLKLDVLATVSIHATLLYIQSLFLWFYKIPVLRVAMHCRADIGFRHGTHQILFESSPLSCSSSNSRMDACRWTRCVCRCYV